MKHFALAAALCGIAATGSLDAKGTFTNAKGTPPVIRVINGTPLIVRVGSDNSFQVFNTDIGGTVGQIYPSGSTGLADMGWFVRVNGVLTAPSFDDHGGTATGGIGSYVPYTSPTISTVTGNGAASSPFTVIVTGTTSSGLLATQTVTYVTGNNYFRKDLKLDNPSGIAVSADIFLASDIYLANSDLGIPFQEEFTGSPGGQSCGVTPPFTILHLGLEPAPTHYTAAQYANVWSQVGAGMLDDTIAVASCNPAGIDNGAGLQWRVSIPANGSVSVVAATSFGEIPGALFGVGDPVWNYSVQPQPGMSTTSVACIRNRFPFNRPTNSFGWAPSEGEFYHESAPGGPILAPVGLARAILDCYVAAWNAQHGTLNFGFCWAESTPWYIGTYEHQRQAQFRIFQNYETVCGLPDPAVGIIEGRVTLTRRLYYPPLPAPPTPVLRTGFE